MEMLVIVSVIRMVIFPPLSFYGLPVTSMADDYVHGINKHCWTNRGSPSLILVCRVFHLPSSVIKFIHL